METPLWDLIVKSCSAAGGLLLLLGFCLVAAAEAGLTENRVAGLVTLGICLPLTFVAFAASNMALGRSRKKLSEVGAIASDIAEGRSFTGAADNSATASLKRTSQYLKENVDALRCIAAGDLNVTVQPRSEMDEFGNALQALIHSLRERLCTGDTRETIERDLQRLSMDASSIADGDLTGSPNAECDSTLELSSAFGLMIRNLRSRVTAVKSSAGQISAAACSLEEIADQLAHSSTAQASQTERITSAIASLARQSHDLAENGVAATQAVAETTRHIRLADKFAGENIAAMNSVRKQTQEAVRKTKRLGERSQEMGQIVGLVEDLADRINVVALNVSLQSADSARSEFAAISGEIQQLADRSTKLTHVTSTLVGNISLETKEAAAAVEETIRDVVQGANLAEKVGRSVTDLEGRFTELSDTLAVITDALKYQSRSSRDAAAAISAVAEVTEILRSSARRAVETVRVLSRSSVELRNTVTTFRIPPPTQANELASAESTRFVN
jgi:twitching motility protein PilJ